MMGFINFLTEVFKPNKHFHMTWMRANPIHQGHVEVANSVHHAAKGKNYAIVLSNAHDFVNNPLTPEQKIYYAKKAFGGKYVKIAAPKSTILSYASDLHNKGVTHLHVHAGSDRIEHFKKLLNQYNGKKLDHGYYKFKGIYVHQVGGNRTADSGINSYSGTKMREAARTANSSAFHAMAPTFMRIRDINQMYDDIRRNLKLKK